MKRALVRYNLGFSCICILRKKISLLMLQRLDSSFSCLPKHSAPEFGKTIERWVMRPRVPAAVNALWGTCRVGLKRMTRELEDALYFNNGLVPIPAMPIQTRGFWVLHALDIEVVVLLPPLPVASRIQEHKKQPPPPPQHWRTRCVVLAVLAVLVIVVIVGVMVKRS